MKTGETGATAGCAERVEDHPAKRSNVWKSLALVMLVALVNAAAFQGSRGLFETTEGRYAECARETMLTGDWDDPVLNGQPHWTKPPLTYAAIIVGMRIFGENPWGVRAYLVAALVLASAAVWWTGVSIWGPAAGRWAGLVFATSPAITAAACSVSADLLVALWTALAAAAFWHSRANRSVWAVVGTWCFASLGMLTKGPPALLVPAFLLGSASMFMHRGSLWRPPLWTTAVGVIVFLGIGCGWYFAEAMEKPGLLAYWFNHELIARNISPEFHRNPQLAYVFTSYLPLLLLGTGPWLVVLAIHCRQLFRVVLTTWPGLFTWNGIARWSLIAGVAGSFLVFAGSHSRLPLYLTPLFVPLALMLGRGLEIALARGCLPARTVNLSILVLLGLTVAAKAVIAMPEVPRDMTRLAKHLAPVLERVQPAALYSVGLKPLHGLEFHLRRTVEPLWQGDFENLMRARCRMDARSFYLIRKEDWNRLAASRVAAVEVEELGPCWIGVRPAANPSPSGNPI